MGNLNLLLTSFRRVLDVVFETFSTDNNGSVITTRVSMPVHRLNTNYDYISCSREVDSSIEYAREGLDMVVQLTVSTLIRSFRFIVVRELKKLCAFHGVRINGSPKTSLLRERLLLHDCQLGCSNVIYKFRARTKPRKNVEWKFTSTVMETAGSTGHRSGRRVSIADADEEDVCDDTTYDEAESDGEEETDTHLEVADMPLRHAIIDEWQSAVSTVNMKRRGCSVCARLTTEEAICRVDPSAIPLYILQNKNIPSHLLPTDYNMQAYDMAILHSPGLTNKKMLAPMYVCEACDSSLRSYIMPRYALANWLYYGHSALPTEVRRAFEEATPFERMLIARARASNICFRFGSYFGAGQDNDETPSTGTYGVGRKGVRGNIMVTPLDVTRLTSVLPPDPQTIADTMCAVFVGQTMPSRDTISKMAPVLVRKSRVKTMIEFLVEHNPHYKKVDGFGGFSAENLNALFGKEDIDRDEAVPCSMGIGHLPMNNAVASATSDYTPRNEYEGNSGTEFLMENVGFTTGDESPQSYKEMKLKALTHCLSGGMFLVSQRGSSMVPDFDNPFILSWLFPHLDPWGIGGFHHPKRKIPLSMEQQLSHVIQVEGAQFERDPEFAFVFYNVIQKKTVSQNVRFKASRSRYVQIVEALMKVDVERLTSLQAKFKTDPRYNPSDGTDVEIIRLLASVNMIGRNIPGSHAYQISLRNEIRALINNRGTPTLFVTLNPSDVDHPLVRLNAGHDIDLEDISRGEDLDKWSRALVAAKNPSACAIFFDTMITRFIRIVLRARSDHRGLFGRCSSYYGTVEANGRGTLHCHMLIWLRGHPSPQVLRDRMEKSEEYRLRTFKWLESIIKCELLGTEEVVVEHDGPIPRPKRSVETGDPHPGTIPSPLFKNAVSVQQFNQDFEGFVNAIVKEYNWHVHTSSCWKHLGRHQERGDSTCRMGIDGHTCATTNIDKDTGSILLRRLHPRIAAYNDVVIFLMKCNMDIKFVGSGEAAKAYLYYLTDYITKPSLPVHVGLAALSYAIRQTNTRLPALRSGTPLVGDDTQQRALIITVNSMMGHREISHQQVMSYLVGGGDHYTSDRFQVLYWHGFVSLANRLFPINAGAKDYTPSLQGNDGLILDEERRADVHRNQNGGDAPDVTDDDSVVLQLGIRTITASNQIMDYMYRSEEVPFDGMCLYEFVELVNKVRIPERFRELISAGMRDDIDDLEGSLQDENHPQYDTHILRLRSKRVVPVILGERISRPDRGEEERELWCRDILLLFVPWRAIGELRDNHASWSDAFNEKHGVIRPRFLQIIRNLNVLSECRDARGEQAMQWRNERRRDEPGVFEVDDVLESMLGDAENTVQSADVFGAFDAKQTEGESRSQLIDSELGPTNSLMLDYCLAPGNTEPHGRVETLGSAEMMSPDANDDVQLHALAMTTLKKKRRPEYHHSLQEPQPNRRRTNYSSNEPSVILASIDLSRPIPVDANALPPNTNEWDVLEGVLHDMNMMDNTEQQRALRIMARHVIDHTDQLLMYIAGVGGTGKSHLINALVTFFERIGRREELLLGAPTGIAAVLIGGYTLHSLSMTNPHKKASPVEELAALWKGVSFLVVDEVSMVGSLFLSQFSSRLKQAKADESMSAFKPFGGISVVFLGDFGQLKPPRQHSLFSYQLVDNPSFVEGRDIDGVGAMNGAFLWRQVNVVVKLVKNHRHDTDPDYAEFLQRIRLGTSRPLLSQFKNADYVDDLEYLRQREISRIAANEPSSLLEFRDAPVIVGSREIRDAINAKYISFHAKRLRQEVHIYYARDSMKRTAVSGSLRDRLWRIPSREVHDHLGRLPLFPGMKVMITENLAFSKGIVNGVEGTIHDIKFTCDDNGRRFAGVVYLRIEGVDVEIPGLERGLVPVFPESVSFDFKVREGETIKSRTVSRKQLPLIPAYSYTDFKSQGRTLDRAIVDLYTARGQGVYVMLSRARSLQGIAILRWFPSTKVFQRISEDLRNELDRIERLDDATAMSYMFGNI